LRILHLGKYYPPAPGGIESHVQTLARGQAGLGHDVKVICVNHADPDGRDITHSRWRRTRSSQDLDGSVQVDRVGRLFGVNRLEVCPALLGSIRRANSDADVVHLHTPNPLMLAAWWMAGKRNVPLVVTHHSDVIKQRVMQLAVRPIEKAVYGKAKAIFTTNPKYLAGSNQLARFSDKVSSLTMGIDLEPYYLNTKKYSQNPANRNGPLWLMVGRLTYYKGYHVAIESLAKVAGNLVIVGNGPLERQLKDQAENLNVADRINWKPSVSQEELIALYHAATALWFPSIARSEGFGLVQVEAMACGCPVINTAVPDSGVSWVSQHGVSGLTVPVGDCDSLALAANSLAEDPDLRRKLAEGALNRAKMEFDSKTMSRRSVDLYSKTLGKCA